MADGVRVGRKRVERLIRQAGITVCSPERAAARRSGCPVSGSGDDLVNRAFLGAASDRLWVADITYLRTWEGWRYRPRGPGPPLARRERRPRPSDSELRSPDARDAAGRARLHDYTIYNSDRTPFQDLPWPDARDAARGVLRSAPALRVIHRVEPAPTSFNWRDAAIGAATSFGLVLLFAGGVISVSRRGLRIT